MSACKCKPEKVLGSGGFDNCVPVPQQAKRTIRVPLFDNSGNRNGIDMTQIGNSVYWDGLFSNPDPSQRFSPTPSSKTIVRTQADDITESFDDQTSVIVQDGVISVVNTIVSKASPAMSRELKTDKCAIFGEYVVDNCGGVYGGDVEGDILYPIDVDADTLSVRFTGVENTTSAKVTLSYQYDTLVQDDDIYYLDPEEIVVNLLKVAGLKPLEITLSNAIAASVDAKVTGIYGYANKLAPVPGLVPADFTVTNKTTDSAIVVASITIIGDGEYTLVYDVPDQPAVGNDVEVYVSKATLSPDDRGTIETA